MSATIETPVAAPPVQPSPPRCRITGLDMARGLAICGMFGAHVGPDTSVGGVTGAAMTLAHGRSSILFATLAGVSLALLTRPKDGVSDRSMRIRVAVRALLILALGTGLVAAGTPVVVILAFYGLMFLLALPFLRMRARTLFTVAAGWAVAGPVASMLLQSWSPATSLMARIDAVDPIQHLSGEGLTALLLTGFYPAITWMPFLLVGLGLGRLGVARIRRRVLAAVGAGLAVVGYGGSALALSLVPGAADGGFGGGYPGGFGGYGGSVDWTSLLGAVEHTGTPFEIVGGVGVAFLVISACLWLAERFPRLTRPLVAMGAMSLTVYTLHVLAIDVSGLDAMPGPALWVLLTFIAGAAAFSVAWLRFFRRGPLEQVVHVVSMRASGSR